MFRIPPERPRQDAVATRRQGSTVNLKQVVHCSHVIVILLARTAACFLSACRDFLSWLPRLDFQEPCMPSAMQAAVCQGVLVHGPLLGWAKMKGDQIFVYRQTMSSRDDTISYLMPRRHGLYKFKYLCIDMHNMIFSGSYISINSNISIYIQIRYFSEILCHEFKFFWK